MKRILIFLAFSFFSETVHAQKSEFFTSSVDPVKDIAVFPNPASDFISVIFEEAKAKEASLVMYTIIGNEVSIEPELIDENEVRIRVRDLPSGYYLIAVRHEKSGLRVTRKFLKR